MVHKTKRNKGVSELYVEGLAPAELTADQWRETSRWQKANHCVYKGGVGASVITITTYYEGEEWHGTA